MGHVAAGGTMPRWMMAGVLAALAVGVYFRFHHLDRKMFWHDETMAAVRLSGFYGDQVRLRLAGRGPVTPAELRGYQQARADRGLGDTLFCLAYDDAKHPPLYYALLYGWARAVGSSVWALRLLSAVASVLVLAGVYWVSVELFASRRVAWIAVALVAVSPLHVLYAQEVRQYAVWLALVCAATALLLRAIRVGTNGAWWAYAVATTLALYTHTLTGFLIGGHLVYVLATVRGPAVRRFVGAVLIVLVAFAPWGAVIALRTGRLRGNTAWVTENIGPARMAAKWVLGLSAPYYDTRPQDLLATSVTADAVPWYVLRLGLVVMTAWCMVRLVRGAPRRQWLLPIAVAAVFVVGLGAPDLVLGGRRSAVPRFMLPAYLMFHLGVAWVIAQETGSAQRWRRAAACAGAGGLVLIGVISCAAASEARAWWNKGACGELAMARVINAGPRPLLISAFEGGDMGRVLALSHLLKPDAAVEVAPSPRDVTIPAGYSHVYVLNARPGVKQMLERMGYAMEEADAEGQLLRVTGMRLAE